ncbi:uncharacterized protein EV422DRAFT_515883 [Fimicolochytrium jonesii]|uniref:uncharacterized protein n=1 Tax=Fimicolochytrium jonesii TaxID=1396493 RepID=UPI0022FECD7B|nr:uncharacterized protein EV422DRAFT_515883 [Fimicolochytrium jonesii]KAI8826235.1 hypothetical protein EV422DRAFT_515883 [Fimicolochytrium jonesii]
MHLCSLGVFRSCFPSTHKRPTRRQNSTSTSGTLHSNLDLRRPINISAPLGLFQPLGGPRPPPQPDHKSRVKLQKIRQFRRPVTIPYKRFSLPPAPTLPPSTAPRTSMTVTFLPLELIAEILLASDGRTLARCARVCKLWNNLATPTVYAVPEIASASAFEKFLQTIEKNKTLGELVRELNLLSAPGHWEFVNNAALERLLNACPHITHLDLEGCRSLYDRALPALAKTTHLQSLSLAYCDRLTDAGVRDAIALLPHLRHLELKCLPFVTDDALEPLARHPPALPHLESLNIAGTNASDMHLPAIIKNLAHLTFLDISGTHCVQRFLETCGDTLPAGLELVVDSLEGFESWENVGNENDMTEPDWGNLTDDDDAQIGWGATVHAFTMSLDI